VTRDQARDLFRVSRDHEMRSAVDSGEMPMSQMRGKQFVGPLDAG
jgi:hypothetical protein